MSGQTPAFAYGVLSAAFTEAAQQFLSEVGEGMKAFRSGVVAARKQLEAAQQRASEDRDRRARLAAFEASDPERRLADLGRRIAAERARHGIGA